MHPGTKLQIREDESELTADSESCGSFPRGAAMRSVFVALLALTFVAVAMAGMDPCLVHTNCYDCLYNDEMCGWCGSNGLCLTAANETHPASAGTCYNLDDEDADYFWEFTTSRVLETSGQSGYIRPATATVFLRPGIPVNVTVYIDVPLTPPIDFLLLQDASISMKDDIQTVRSLMPQIVGNLTALTNGTDCPSHCLVVGLASFLEKPIMPFANWPEAWVYRLESPVPALSHETDRMISALDQLLESLARNFEHPETSLEAVLYSVQDPGVGWRDGSFKLPMVLTDASSHEAGDGAKLGIFVPNNGDGVMDGVPPGTGEDYPSRDLVRRKAIENDATPMFAATTNVYPYYRNLVEEWGFGAAVEIAESAENIVEAIVQGAQEALSKAVLAVTSDDLSRVSTIYPDGGVYSNVQPLSTISFNITMLAPLDNEDDFGASGEAILKYVGFGSTVTIYSETLIECVGCDATNSTAQIDLCGVCGGNSTLCIGCDGVLNSGVNEDACGICGGGNESCVGCDGLVNGEVYDVCGVCGGNGSSCVGCDGIPNSGKEWNGCATESNPRGICGGPANCDLAGVVAGLSAVAAVGIVIAALAVFFLIGTGATMARADANLLEEESTLQENPLYEEAKRKFDNPLYAPN